MRYSINVPNFGEFADARAFAELAGRAEAAGWDAVWVWDHLMHERRRQRVVADPWILLAAAGLATDRILLGPMVTPLARRRIGKLAREVTTLDRMTGGRIVLGVGLGAPIEDEFGRFGEPTAPRAIAERLDESLDALALLWTGEPATYQGRHVTLDDVLFRPTPVQRPRVPIWVAGNWPNKAPMRRAARWDGVTPILPGTEEGAVPEPAVVGEMVDFVASHRAELGRAGEPFDVVVGGTTPAGRQGADLVGPLADAGATWWDERMALTSPDLERLEPMLRRIDQGPPRIA
jgi:alkanesulfonate monooxygenase SsuD/methylene tetrahydromethanopterin reductase-like flavin-dependent oxidoreductase (luciferase family)